VLTHGFLIDVDGRKMSKSLGNTILPQEVMKESGAEILRLWVSMSDFREELRVGKQILARVVEAYRKFRNTLRYRCRTVHFDPASDRVALDSLQEVDRYILSRYGATADTVVRAYERYDYPVIFQTLNQS
jgi:isoleucyl-tRNA synthetase